MCGIAGIIGARHGEPLRDGLRRRIAHRGPDDHGDATVDGAILLHSRLSILDLSCAGHQPMEDRPQSGLPNTVVFNGEIYNFVELQSQLAQAGWPCATRSDTEVLLNAYRAWGEAFLDRLRGMWAFVLVDRERGVAHLSRDRFGIKPLYMYRPVSGGLVFASELRALLAVVTELATVRVNPAALESYLAQGAVQGFDTIVEGITLLPPATLLTVDLRSGNELRSRQFWQLPPQTSPPPSRGEAVEGLAKTLRESVRLHLVSDVATGLFLSGGVDSAALLALASEQSPGAVRTLNVGFDIPQFDESAQAASMAAHFNAQHTSVRLTGADVLRQLPSAFDAMDQPTVDGINVFIVSNATRDAGLTVALSGLGSDELFGGYSSFEFVPRAVATRQWLPVGRAGTIASLLKPDRAGMKAAEMFLRKPELLSMYLLRRELFVKAERRALHGLPPCTDADSGLATSLLDEARCGASGLDVATRISLFELTFFMRHMLLRDGDAFSMAAPIEYRVPFLDHQLAEEVFRLPGPWKRPDPRPKPLLLDAVGRGRIPATAWESPKRGFTFPWGVWFSPGGPLASLADQACRDEGLWNDLGLNPKAVAEIWTRFSRGDRRVAGTQILAFVTLREFAMRHNVRA